MRLRPPASRRRAWLGAALALLGLAAAAPSARAQGGVWTTLQVQGGSVLGVADGDSGRVVIAGSNGAWVFDGLRLRRLPIFATASDSLKGTAVLRARNGDTWFGTQTGVIRLRADGTIERYDATHGLGNSTSSEVTCLAEDAAGTIWVGTGSGGLSRFDGATWSTLTTDQGLTSNSVTAVAVDPTDQSLWVGLFGLAGGLAHVVNGAVANEYHAFALTSNRNVRAVIATPSGRVWFGTDGGIGRIENGQLAEFATSGSAISALAEGANGEIWFGTLNRGVGRLDDARALFLASGPPSTSVTALFADAAGVLWVSTSAGLGRYEGAPWLPIAKTTGQPPEFAPLVAARDAAREAPGDSVDASGVVWLGLQSIPVGPDFLNLARRVRGGLKFFGSLDGLPGGYVSALAPADSGQVWVGSYSPPGPGTNPGLARITLEGVVRRIETTSLPSPDVFALARAGDASVWAGTRLGAALVDPAGVHALPTSAAAVPNAPIRGLGLDAQGRVWIATGPTSPSDGRPGQGAVRFDPADSSYLHLTVADGLPTNNLNSVTVFRNGDVWFGSPLGAVRNRGGALTVFTTALGLPSNGVFNVAEGRNGEAWIATASGLVEYDGANLTIYNVADGMSSSALANVFADSLVVLASHKTDGVSLLHVDRTPPRAEIQLAPPLATGSKLVQFGIAGGDLDSDNRGILLSYQLDGRPPTPFASNVTSAEFPDLLDGDYTFRLWAKDRALNVTPDPETWTFTVDATAPRPIVEKPVFNSIVKGTVDVIGNVADPRFAFYTIELRPQGRISWDTLFVSNALPAAGDTLYKWDTTAQNDGVWELRVGSSDSLGLSGYVQVTTIVDNLAPSASVTAPAKIDHVLGGRIFTTLGEVELAVPPNAYAADQIVFIDAIPTPPAMPPFAPVGTSWASAWALHATDMTLDKPATLTVQLPGVPAGLPVAIYRLQVSGVDTTLVPLGGARAADGLSITTTISELGSLVVLYGAVSGGEGFAGARGLDLQPRVLSPNGGGFDTRLAISFDVGRPGQGAVKVFDRAGRLVREVVEDGAFAPGRNVVFWDGKDGGGKIVPSGLYMVAVRFDGGTQVASVAVANR
jgi:ligand-binding sensor domain-containing protein